MRLLKFFFYLTAITFSVLIVKIMFHSFRDYNSPNLRHTSIDHTVVPCGERELHDEMVQYISEYEPRYLHCLRLERDDRDFRSTECAQFGRGHTDMLRRYHKLRNEQELDVRIMQIGSMDGKSNDPIYLSIFRPHLSLEAAKSNYWPPYSVERVHATLVEPLHMKNLKKQYADWSLAIPGMSYSNFKFVKKAVNDENNINELGNCKFYKVSHDCPLKLRWANQISALDPLYMRKIFTNLSSVCIEQNFLPCVSISGILRETGWDLQQRPSLRLDRGGNEWCNKNDTKSIADVLVIDTEGFDGNVIHMTLRDLCPTLWPAIIIYEDKVLRSKHKDINLDEKRGDYEEDTEDADSVIDFLEQNGYYVLLLGEDAIALRVGYSIDAMRHTLFDPPDLSIFRQKAWLHPRSSRNLA